MIVFKHRTEKASRKSAIYFFHFRSFETENKIRAEEKAVLKNPNTVDEGIASKGFYEYIGPDGFMYRVDYTADEKGFRPSVKRLETPYSGKWIYEKVN